ncbi:MAG: hypothetical protein MJZ81_06295 [Bacteroidales bacterium]|nr:hypothetical protein [Bacteroidales bacterium]
MLFSIRKGLIGTRNHDRIIITQADKPRTRGGDIAAVLHTQGTDRKQQKIMEHAIGTRITLEVVERTKARGCNDCFFGKEGDCIVFETLECDKFFRADHKDIVYKLIKENTPGSMETDSKKEK